MTSPLPTSSAALDLRGALHMAPRCRMFHTLVQVDRMDAAEVGELERTVHAVRQLLDLVQEAPCPLHELLDALGRGRRCIASRRRRRCTTHSQHGPPSRCSD